MAFPISPANNATTIVNGISYIYNATNGTWTRQLGIISEPVGAAAFNQANTATIIAQAAYAQANTGGGGSSVDQTARTQANTANLVAISAYAQANTANTVAIASYVQANTATIIGQAAFARANSEIIGTAAYVQANTSNTVAIAAYVQANTANTVAIASYVQANTATIIGQAAYVQANTSNTVAISSYVKANTATIIGQAAYVRANSEIIGTAAYVQANTSNTVAIAAYVQANTATIIAQAAYNQANVGGTAIDQTARTYANNAYNQANTATIIAQAAYAQANTGGGGASSNSFATILVAGQPNVIANTPTGRLTLVAGSGMTITTAQTSNTITFASSGGGSMVYPTNTGIAVVTGGTAWGTTLTAPSGDVVGTTDTQTLTNKRINSRVVSANSASSLTPDVATADVYAYTALAAGLTINAPTGTPVDGNKLMFRLLDNGTARALTWNATYTVIGVTLPTTTVVNKTTYVGCIYNANNTRWDVIAVTTQA